MAIYLPKILEWAYRVARELSDFQHARAETRYSQRLVEQLFQVGDLVRVLRHKPVAGAPSKLAPKYSDLCESIFVRGARLIQRELNTRRVFTANHDAERKSTLSHPVRPFQSPAVSQKSDIPQLWEPPLRQTSISLRANTTNADGFDRPL